MPDDRISYSARNLDLSQRFVQSAAVVASPTDNTETIICTVTIPGSLALISGVFLYGFAAFTVGTNGVSGNLKIRQTDASGTTKGATGATTVVAANLVSRSVQAVDLAPVGAQVYVLTLTVGSGSAASAVSAAQLVAIVV